MVAHALDLAGRTFGRLTAIRRVASSREGSIWECSCECGKSTRVTAGRLVSGKTRSCGCLAREMSSVRNSLSLEGRTFGRLTAIRRAGSTIRGEVIWECSCACGGFSKVNTSRLTSSGGARSCGCLAHEMTSARESLSLEGRVFGRLTVIQRVGVSSSGKVIWECSCVCGGSTRVRSVQLTSGRTVSCGCAKSNPKSRLRPVAVRLESKAHDHARRARKRESGGSFSKQDVQNLYKKQKSRCAGCRRKVSQNGKCHIDHIMPLCLGGGNGVRNIQLLCQECNLRKGGKHPLEWARENGWLV